MSKYLDEALKSIEERQEQVAPKRSKYLEEALRSTGQLTPTTPTPTIQQPSEASTGEMAKPQEQWPQEKGLARPFMMTFGGIGGMEIPVPAMPAEVMSKAAGKTLHYSQYGEVPAAHVLRKIFYRGDKPAPKFYTMDDFVSDMGVTGLPGFALSMALGIGLDWTTYASVGIGALSEVGELSRFQRLAQAGKIVVDPMAVALTGGAALEPKIMTIGGKVATAEGAKAFVEISKDVAQEAVGRGLNVTTKEVGKQIADEAVSRWNAEAMRKGFLGTAAEYTTPTLTFGIPFTKAGKTFGGTPYYPKTVSGILPTEVISKAAGGPTSLTEITPTIENKIKSLGGQELQQEKMPLLLRVLTLGRYNPNARRIAISNLSTRIASWFEKSDFQTVVDSVIAHEVAHDVWDRISWINPKFKQSFGEISKKIKGDVEENFADAFSDYVMRQNFSYTENVHRKFAEWFDANLPAEYKNRINDFRSMIQTTAPTEVTPTLRTPEVTPDWEKAGRQADAEKKLHEILGPVQAQQHLAELKAAGKPIETSPLLVPEVHKELVKNKAFQSINTEVANKAFIPVDETSSDLRAIVNILHDENIPQVFTPAQKIEIPVEQKLLQAPSGMAEITPYQTLTMYDDAGNIAKHTVERIDEAGNVTVRKLGEPLVTTEPIPVQKYDFTETFHRQKVSAIKEQIQAGNRPSVEVRPDDAGNPLITDGIHTWQAYKELGIEPNYERIGFEPTLGGIEPTTKTLTKDEVLSNVRLATQQQVTDNTIAKIHRGEIAGIPNAKDWTALMREDWRANRASEIKRWRTHQANANKLKAKAQELINKPATPQAIQQQIDITNDSLNIAKQRLDIAQKWALEQQRFGLKNADQLIRTQEGVVKRNESLLATIARQEIERSDPKIQQQVQRQIASNADSLAIARDRLKKATSELEAKSQYVFRTAKPPAEIPSSFSKVFTDLQATIQQQSDVITRLEHSMPVSIEYNVESIADTLSIARDRLHTAQLYKAHKQLLGRAPDAAEQARIVDNLQNRLSMYDGIVKEGQASLPKKIAFYDSEIADANNMLAQLRGRMPKPLTEQERITHLAKRNESLQQLTEAELKRQNILPTVIDISKGKAIKTQYQFTDTVKRLLTDEQQKLLAADIDKRLKLELQDFAKRGTPGKPFTETLQVGKISYKISHAGETVTIHPVIRGKIQPPHVVMLTPELQKDINIMFNGIDAYNKIPNVKGREIEQAMANLFGILHPEYSDIKYAIKGLAQNYKDTVGIPLSSDDLLNRIQPVMSEALKLNPQEAAKYQNQIMENVIRIVGEEIPKPPKKKIRLTKEAQAATIKFPDKIIYLDDAKRAVEQARTAEELQQVVSNLQELQARLPTKAQIQEANRIIAKARLKMNNLPVNIILENAREQFISPAQESIKKLFPQFGEITPTPVKTIEGLVFTDVSKENILPTMQLELLLRQQQEFTSIKGYESTQLAREIQDAVQQSGSSGADILRGWINRAKKI